MVRLWTLEAHAHGADVVSYFRWRQASFAQEQMHAGLNLPSSHELSQGGREAAAAANDLARLGDFPRARPLRWRSSTIMRRIGLPRYSRKAQIFAIRSWSSAGTRRSGASALTSILCRQARRSRIIVLCWFPPCRLSLSPLRGVRCSDRDCRLRPAIRFENPPLFDPGGIASGRLQSLLNTRVTEVSSLRPGVLVEISGAICGHAERWREQVETRAETLATFGDGAPALVAKGNYHYLACWPDVGALGMLMALLCEKAGLATIELPTEVRLRRRGGLTFAFNYGQTPWRAPFSDEPLLGEPEVMPRNFTVWRTYAASAKDGDWAGFGAELDALRPPLEQLSRQLAARHWRHLVDP